MRVAIGAIEHETNTFSPIPTPLAAFHEGRDRLLAGAALVDEMRGSKTELGAFLEVGEREGWEIVPTIGAWATPSGDVDAAAWDTLKGALLDALRAAGHLDGVLLNLHGAMLAANAHDAEGDLCQAVRALVGADVPIMLSMDLHGNITPTMCAAVDAVFVFDTNPHIDGYERGLETAYCLARVLRGEFPRPLVAISKPPMLPPTINMRTAEGPMASLLERGREWESRPGIVNVAIFPGFPYADFDLAGTAVVVTATDAALARAGADDVARAAWSMREQFLKSITPIHQAVELALQPAARGEGPLVLADVADNPGGGGSGDTTGLLRELIRRGAAGAVAAFWDPAVVEQAMVVGIDSEASFQLGGKMLPELYGPPIELRARVTHLCDGRFIGWGPVYRGRAVDCGPTACLAIGDLRVVVTTQRHAANDRGFFQMVGIQPERLPTLMIKSRGHFRADFQPIAHAIVEVDAPGAANPNLDRYPFRRVRRPIWPLDPATAWDG